jgi:hypothetical protein
MARRQKNLLEAFQASSIEGHTPRVPPAEPEPPRPVRRPEPVVPRRSLAGPGVRRIGFALAVLAGVLLVFWIGRWSADDVQAEAPRAGKAQPARAPERAKPPVTGAAAGSGAGLAAAPAGEPAREATLDDRRFRDPANLYTVRVIEYRNDERGRQLAWSCYEYLRREGLPVISPIEQGSAVILYVGASSDVPELDAIADFVSQMRGPPPQSRPREFEGAYRVNIDDVIQR